MKFTIAVFLLLAGFFIGHYYPYEYRHPPFSESMPIYLQAENSDATPEIDLIPIHKYDLVIENRPRGYDIRLVQNPTQIGEHPVVVTSRVVRW